MKRQFFWLLLMIIFLLLPLIPFFRPGFFVTDDGEWMIIRLSDFHRSLADGQIPPRWAGRLNHQYGYPVFNFLYPGMLYFGEIFHLLGLGFIDSVKALFIATFVFSALFTFFWIHEIFKKDLEAFIASLFFTFLPYHLFDVFHRGSLGEVTALTFVPLFFWAVEKNLFWLEGLSFGLMILSHNSIALLFLPVFICYLWLRVRERKKELNLKQLAFPFLLGLGLSAFFWIPVLFELPYTKFQHTEISQPEHYFLTFQTISLIGIAGVFILILNIPFLIKKKKKIVLLFCLIYLTAIFFSLSQSRIFWIISPFKNLIQFPFRFLSLTLPAAAYLSALFLDRFKESKKIMVATFLVAILLLFSRSYLAPTEYINKGEGFYTTNEGTTTVADEYLPTWVKIKPQEKPEKKVEVIKGKAMVKDLVFTSKKTAFTIFSETPSMVQINTIYYPDWLAFINGKKSAINYQNDKGLITFPLAKGESHVLVEFRETPLRLFSDIISFVSFTFVLFLVLKKFKFRL